jgi:tRNA nucleotidyltransferase (CCA-adding enzyme)
MRIPSRAELLRRVAALPAGAPLLERLHGLSGVYLVGGAVRDLLLGGAPPDLDLVVEGDAAEVARRIGRQVVVHDRFGTSTVEVGGFSYDLARARRERYGHPGALPEVEPAPLSEDLERRDFTVNAMAIALGGPDAGSVTGAPRAVEDLDGRRLRVLHEKSFIDDPTRLLRLARYQSRLGFAVEARTSQLARQAVDAGALGTVSGTRVGSELRLLAREPDAFGAFAALRELGLDAAIHAGFRLTDPALARHALGLLPADGRPDLLVLSLAAGGVPPSELGPWLDRLGFAAGDRDVILAGAVDSKAISRALRHARTRSEIAAAAGEAPLEAVAIAGALGAEKPATAWLDSLRHVRLEIDGRDLIAAGIPEGPLVGRGLRAALKAKLDGRVDGAEQELQTALEAAAKLRGAGG